MDKEIHTALLVSASARQQDSVTRHYAKELLSALQVQLGEMRILERDVSKGIPFIDEQWVKANFTTRGERSDAHHAALAYSDTLVTELQHADTIVIAAPIYNFSVPASLKAWIDQIARVGLTFNYTSNGPVGKLTNKKAFIVMASGGTALGSDIDFASGYLRHMLKFIGIVDVSVINAEQYKQDDKQAIEDIHVQIHDATRQVA